jgi:hypothetical protein
MEITVELWVDRRMDMEEQKLTEQLKACADLFYQNHEKEAYQMLANLLVDVSGKMQTLTELLAQLPENTGMTMQQKVRDDLQELVTSYQYKDALALADLLYYDIPEELGLLEE